jgi:hypothetical protein
LSVKAGLFSTIRLGTRPRPGTNSLPFGGADCDEELVCCAVGVIVLLTALLVEEGVEVAGAEVEEVAATGVPSVVV